MKDSEIFSISLKAVFKEVTKESKIFFEGPGDYKMTKVRFNRIYLGIGINSDCSAIKFFTIKPNCKGDEADQFTQSFRYGKPVGAPNPDLLSFGLQTEMVSEIGNTIFMIQHLKVVLKIVESVWVNYLIRSSRENLVNL